MIGKTFVSFCKVELQYQLLWDAVVPEPLNVYFDEIILKLSVISCFLLAVKDCFSE